MLSWTPSRARKASRARTSPAGIRAAEYAGLSRKCYTPPVTRPMPTGRTKDTSRKRGRFTGRAAQHELLEVVPGGEAHDAQHGQPEVVGDVFA
ncbi:hypothetical protein GCM10010842_38780 [Deinococcus daejeonensis]|uniref:Uncharacterized protein n=1 Tax=Deinococcus daejeonensis TaxID=1007098 RepID=A0ABQ2JL55_9DEIO|nr:hypothetical protein GCM10010842_38780 [Deinococcus daejeonensis]